MPSDAQLLSDISAGDVGALGQLYDRYAATCWTSAKRLAVGDAAAEQAVQLTFMEIWRHPSLAADHRLRHRLTALAEAIALSQSAS